MFNPQCLRPNRTASNYTTKFCSFFLFRQHSDSTKKCLLYAVLQYLQPTEFYTLVTYGKNDKCIILLNFIISLPFFRLLTRLFCQRFWKTKNVDKIKNAKKVFFTFMHPSRRPTNRADRRRVTSLIRPTPFHTASQVCCLRLPCSVWW